MFFTKARSHSRYIIVKSQVVSKFGKSTRRMYRANIRDVISNMNFSSFNLNLYDLPYTKWLIIFGDVFLCCFRWLMLFFVLFLSNTTKLNLMVSLHEEGCIYFNFINICFSLSFPLSLSKTSPLMANLWTFSSLLN